MEKGSNDGSHYKMKKMQSCSMLERIQEAKSNNKKYEMIFENFKS